jgi:MYXO-CTERM domain-containing protein
MRLQLRTNTCCIWIASLILANSNAQVARAHGGPPSALGLIAINADGPNVVLLNEGLAFANDDGRWSFLCPSLWGDASVAAGKVPYALSIDGQSTWIIGSDDLYVAKGGVLTKQGRSDLTNASVVALTGNGSELFGLRLGTMGSEIVRIETAYTPPVWSSADYWSALTADADGFYLARVVNDRELGFLTLDPQGQTRAEFTIGVETMPARVVLKPTSRGLYAVLFDGNIHYALGSLADNRWQVLKEADGVIAGPQAGPDGQLWVSIGGQLQRITDGGFEPVDESRYVTCLGQWGGKAYACQSSDLYWLEEQGLGERFFQLNEFNGPNPAHVPAEAEEQCGNQWFLFRSDLLNSGLEPQDWPAPPTAAGAAGGGGAGTVAAGESPPAAAAAGSAAMTRAGTAAPPPTAPTESSGCACGLTGTGDTGPSLGGGLLLLALVVQRRRRRGGHPQG